MKLNPNNLPRNDNINPYAFCVEVNGEIFIQKGKMIAYYGQLRFESLGAGPLDMIVQNAFNAPLYARDFIVVTGRGQLILGDRGNDVNSFDLEAGNLTVKADHVLGFEKGLICQQSIVPNYLTLLGTGKFLASSNGPIHFMEPPARVDEQALLGWADLPCPSLRYDHAHIQNALQAVGSIMGLRRTGEEEQIDMTGSGTILVQSSEEALKGRSDLANILSQVTGLHHNDLVQLQAHVAQRLRPN
ncbi:AIM24 family protein [bacterium]|nr:MAG: AIM24 family protein [bacterium]